MTRVSVCNSSICSAASEDFVSHLSAQDASASGHAIGTSTRKKHTRKISGSDRTATFIQSPSLIFHVTTFYAQDSLVSRSALPAYRKNLAWAANTVSKT